MIKPDFCLIMWRAAIREVKKYDFVQAAMGAEKLFDIQVSQRDALQLRVANTNGIEANADVPHLLDDRSEMLFDCSSIKRVDFRGLRGLADVICNGRPYTVKGAPPLRTFAPSRAKALAMAPPPRK